jgi:DNA-binding XRE family transcriptional regulator
MGKAYEELMAELTPERRKRVESRAADLIAEEKTLRDLRQARQLTQQHMAKELGVKQHSISRLEQRSDMLLSTLRDYISKMGGELVLTARFPDRAPVRIASFKDIAEGGKAPSPRRGKRTSTVRARRAPQGANGAHPPVKGKSPRSRIHPVI